MSDESIINLSESTKATIRNYAMVAGFMAIFINSVFIIAFLCKSPEKLHSTSIAISVILMTVLMTSAIILAMVHKRDQIAIAFMAIAMFFMTALICFENYGDLSGIRSIPYSIIAFIGFTMIFTRNEQRYISSLLLLWIGLMGIVWANTGHTDTMKIVQEGVTALIALYAILCIGLENEKFPGYRLLTADEIDETNDGSPVHFKVSGAVLGYAMFAMPMVASVLYYLNWFGVSIDTVFALETSSGIMLILAGLMMLVAGRMKFTPFLFIMLGTVTSLSSFMTEVGQISFIFMLIIGILCIFRSDRRILVGAAIIIYGCTYLISAMYGGVTFAPLSVVLNTVPVLILAYVCLALCSDNRLKLY